MGWDVGDMTCMPAYPDKSFDVVFDKGALDALMSEDTPDVAEKTTAMFLEISRMLSVNGKYICITLAEPYILKRLLSHFSAARWTIVVESLTSKKPSPFKPFYIIISKTIVTDQFQSVSLLVDTLGNDLAVARKVSSGVAIDEVRNSLFSFFM